MFKAMYTGLYIQYQDNMGYIDCLKKQYKKWGEAQRQAYMFIKIRQYKVILSVLMGWFKQRFQNIYVISKLMLQPGGGSTRL